MSSPCAYTDIEWKILYKYKNKEDIYVICSKEGSANYFCKESFLEIVVSALKLFNGHNSIEKITEIMSVKYPEYKVEEMIKKLAKSKFIKGNEEKYISSELKRSSINIKEFDITGLGKIDKGIIRVLYSIFLGLISVSIIICINLLIQNRFIISAYAGQKTQGLYLMKIIVIIVSMIVSLIFHEFAHILVGLQHGLVPIKLGISLYMNVIPMYYIITPGTYLASTYERIKFYIAGVCANFIIFAFFSMFASVFQCDFFYLIAFSNFQLILINLIPFALTDGYFLMSIILKRINLRLDFINIITFQNKNTGKLDIATKIYCVISITYIWILVFNISYWVMKNLVVKLSLGINIITLSLICSILIMAITFFFMIVRTQKIRK